MKDRAGTLVLAIILIAGFAVTGFFLYRLQGDNRPGPDPSLIREVAATLESKGLWNQAAERYSELLARARLEPPERAKLAFHVGEIYLDKLAEPKAALPWFFTAKVISENSELGAKADKRIVAALERSGQSLDAANYLSEVTSLESSGNENKAGKAEGETVLAKVGDREITMRDLEDSIQTLPPNMQERFKSPEGKMEFLQSMIARELILNAARRAGLDDEPEVKKAVREAREAAIIAKYHEDKIDSGIRITESDVRTFYENNKEKFTRKDEEGNEEPMPYERVKDSARAMLKAEKRREKLNQLVNKLRRSEGVEIYRERLTEN